MKKIAVVLLALMMCFALAACGTPSPSDAVAAELDVAKDDPDMFADSTAFTDAGLSQEASDILYEKFLDFEYVIGDETIDGENATVEVTIKTYPLGDIFEDVFTSLISQIMSDPTMDVDTAMSDLLIEKINAAEKTYEQTVTLDLVMSDGQWQVQTNDDIVNALSGGMNYFVNNMDRLLA